MKRRILQARSRRWWLLSIAAHIVFVLVLAQVMFKYPLGQLMGISRREIRQEKLHYITVPQPTEHSGGTPQPAATVKRGGPAPLPVPTTTPTPPPTLAPLDTPRSVAAGGTGTGLDAYGSGLATGLVPRLPDSRIDLTPGDPIRTPRSTAEDVDSIVRLAIGIVADSMEIAAGQRKPGDWTVKGKDGKVWGWDQNGIRLGKFTIPQALLALLPLNIGANQDPIAARRSAWIRNDIMAGAQRQISEDEFRAAVKRIRERKDRERRDRQVAADGKPISP
ncbi:MAG: hypothetical protein ACRENU_04220 [Gemmatimonadaceae bacterium]